jgi:hypothetical protein
MDCATTSSRGLKCFSLAALDTLGAIAIWAISCSCDLEVSHGRSLAGHASALRSLEEYSHAFLALGDQRGLESLFKALADDPDNEYAMIDATIVRAHQHSAGARKKKASTKP